MRVWPESQYFSGAAREVKRAGGEDVVVLANILLRHVDNQIFAGKSEVRTATALHVLGRCLRKRGDQDWQRDGGVAIHVTLSARRGRACRKPMIHRMRRRSSGRRDAERQRRTESRTCGRGPVA